MSAETKPMDVRDAIREAHRFIESRADESGYGYARPANPHDFSPDRECCTDEEIAAHKAACEAFDAGLYVHDSWDGWNADHTIHVLKAPWGVGSYTIRDAWAQECLTKLQALDAAVAEMIEALRNSDEWVREAVNRGGCKLPSSETLYRNSQAFASIGGEA